MSVNVEPVFRIVVLGGVKRVAKTAKPSTPAVVGWNPVSLRWGFYRCGSGYWWLMWTDVEPRLFCSDGTDSAG